MPGGDREPLAAATLLPAMLRLWSSDSIPRGRPAACPAAPAGEQARGPRGLGNRTRMLFTQSKPGPHSRRATWTVGKSVGLGAAAGAASAAAALLGPKAVTSARAGKGHPLKHRVLDLASGALQRKYPVEAISTYLNGFHMYADDMGRQVEASHFCIHLRHDLHQCVIFDRNAPGARLIGIEYIISEERFRGLPDTRNGSGTATTTRSSQASWSPLGSLAWRSTPTSRTWYRPTARRSTPGSTTATTFPTGSPS